MVTQKSEKMNVMIAISAMSDTSSALESRAEKIWQLGKKLGLKARREQENAKIKEQFKEFIKEIDLN